MTDPGASPDDDNILEQLDDVSVATKFTQPRAQVVLTTVVIGLLVIGVIRMVLLPQLL